MVRFHALRAQETLRVVDALYERNGSRADLAAVRRRAYAWLYFRMASGALAEGKAFPDGMRWLWRSLSCHVSPIWESKRHTAGILKHALNQMLVARR